jgi:hypothetical protein
MSYLSIFTLYSPGCSHPCSVHIFWPSEHIFFPHGDVSHISFVSFVRVVCAHGLVFGSLVATCLQDAEKTPVLSVHETQPVSCLPTRHSMGTCFARPFLLHFYQVLQHTPMMKLCLVGSSNCFVLCHWHNLLEECTHVPEFLTL